MSRPLASISVLASISAVFFLAACQSPDPLPSIPAPKAIDDSELRAFLAEEEAIRLAVFSDQVRRPKQVVCFLGLAGGQDPDPATMKHFASLRPAVKPASACEHRNDGVWDVVTGERGTLYTVGDITPTSDDEVEVSASYYHAGDGGAGYSYRLKKIAGKWKVTDVIVGWFS